MTPFMKKINLALGLLCTTVSTGYSYADDLYAPTCIENPCYYPCQPPICIENPCCSPCQPPKGHAFIGAELLYWRPFQDGLDTCIPTDVSDTVLSDGRIISTFEGRGKDPHFEWDPGFRIGAGYEFACSNWDIGVLWSHFNSRAHRSLSDENRLRWHINLDVIDLLMAYQPDFNSCFSLRPYFGLRVARIHQKLRLGTAPNATNFAIVGETLFGADNKHKFIGVGPLFGLEVDLRVACGFSLYVNGDVSWLYGRNRVRLTNSTATTDVIDYSNIKSRPISTIMAADASIGVRWQTCFCTDKQLFLQLAYEHHRYFDYSRIGKCCEDLSFDGVSFGAGVGF